MQDKVVVSKEKRSQKKIKNTRDKDIL